ncbi:MAG: DEAD/DEAH box helicase, partial [Verrucomicrobia bacterium]|nr:DEAD/DEAH box helicase [Verrucomicrobiota bacterium]
EIELRVPVTAMPPIILGATTWAVEETRLRPLALPEALRELLRGPLRLGRARVPEFLAVEWPAWCAVGEVTANFSLEDFTLEPASPQFRLELAGGLTELRARLACAYGAQDLAPAPGGSAGTLWLPDPANATRYFRRDLEAERSAVARLLRAGFNGPDARGDYSLSGQNSVLNFFAREFPRLRREWEVGLEERLERNTAQSLERIEPRVQVTSSGIQWFDFNVTFAAPSGQALGPADLQRLLNSGQSYLRLRNGRIALLDTDAVEELQEALVDCAPQQHDGAYRVNHTQAGFLEATLRQRNGWSLQAPASWLDHLQPRAAVIQCPPLDRLETVLRPYQKHGVAWLHFLRRNGFGGILADEMGLGKTLQTLAFLQSVQAAGAFDSPGRRPALRNDDPSPGGPPASASLPSLVICPTSLVANWVAEARKFTPDLRVLALHGPDRHAQFDQLAGSDLVVTSYAVLRRDVARYRGLQFDTVVLDEAQHIKNRQSQNAQAVKAVPARQRLVLTGTPLENSVLDLWSIFDFLMPGYLGAAQEFRQRYELPITRDRQPEAQARLARRLRPFLLRRLKREVAPELPAKLEQVVLCDLTAPQQALYRQVLQAGRLEVLAAVGARGFARSRTIIFNALLRLRQICCDLRLLKLEHVDPATASGKVELFDELLEEALDGGHRVLVFSQFVSMLTLLRERLEADAVPFCYLDGATRNRAEVIQRFQGRPDIPVFLISLKAGGVGLNLSAADTVIHFDPWWNPAVEQQATDRAHRLGQTRVVTSYKLIARATVEEKMLTLQQRKRELLQAALGAEDQLAEAATWDEIQELFAE